jgi:hypothetical protein
MKRRIKVLAITASLLGLIAWIGIVAFSQQASDGTKFGKYVLTDSLYVKIPYYTGTSIVARDGKLQGNVSMCYHCLTKPMNFDKPHTHDFEETLCFIGGNPLDITDFSAVVEYTIGDEKHVLTKPGCVSMPRGQMHCPISVKNVSPEKPIVFLEVSASSSYGMPTPKKQ